MEAIMSDNASDAYEAKQPKVNCHRCMDKKVVTLQFFCGFEDVPCPVCCPPPRAPDVWTTDLPNKEGFYWKRLTPNDKNPEIRLIIIRNGEFRVCHQHKNEFGTALNLFRSTGFGWAGPFFPPN